MSKSNVAVSSFSFAAQGLKIFDRSPDCVKLLDLNAHILAINKNGQCVMEIDDFRLVENKPWKLFWPANSHPEIEKALETALDAGIGQFQGFCPTAKGTPKWWGVTITSVPGDSGHIESLLVVSRDITAQHQAEIDLHTSEARYRSLVKATAAIVWNGPASGQFETVQASWSAFTGQTFDEYRGWGWLNAVHPEDQARTADAWKNAYEAGTFYQIEHRLRRADGQYRHMSVSGVPLVDANGAIYEWVGLHTDITERIQANLEKERLSKEVQAANDRMSDVFRQAPAFMCVLRGPDHVFELANERYAQLIGHRQVIGQTVRQALPEIEGQGFIELLDRVYQSGESFAGTNMPVLLQRNFDRLLDKRFIDLVFTALRDTDGNVSSVLVHGVDQTERKEAEIALYNSRERLQKIITQAATGVVEADTEGRITLVNQKYCDMLGYSEADLLGKSVLDITAQESIPLTIDTFNVLAAGSADQIIEKWYQRKDGSLMWANSSVSALRDHAGKFQGIVAIVVDISERKQIEEKLKETDRRKDEFLAMLAHELRNPLAPISAAAELLQIVRLDDEIVCDTSQIIVRQVEHMTSLVNDLLDVSRVTRGLIKLDSSQLELRTIVADAVEQVTSMIQSRRHHLVVNLAPDAAIVYGDKKRLIQLVANLVNNAAKYTHEGGNILIKTEVHENHVQLEVIDDGIGMEPELVARVFDLFAQAEVTPDRSSGGLGLGLALVKSLVDLHGGSIACESAGKGLGSKFTVCLPRSVEPVSENLAHPLLQPLQKATQPLRILIVDDNTDAAKTLCMLLEAMGHQVFVEHTGIQALGRGRAEKPAVCLLDIGLPEMDGNELARHLRRQSETADSVLIAVTGYGQEDDRKNTLAAGFDHHFVKPVDIKKLASILAVIRPA